MITAKQCKMARGALGWSLREVAEKVGVNINTVIRFETGSDPISSIRDGIADVFMAAGLVIHPDGITVSDPRPLLKPKIRKAA
jgi:transcriptional regulator with XRE-family HTH domain